MLVKIWVRHFVKEALKIFFFITFCFYGLYVLIDYATHSSANHHHTMMKWGELIHYYAYEWVLRADVLVPFALMVATIRTLCDLNIHNELVALRASGTSLKRILTPFLLIGFVFTALIYINTEWLLPDAMAGNRHIHDQKELAKNTNQDKFIVQHVELKDHSTLLFQNYDLEQNRFFDAYWISNFNEVWRFHYLYPYDHPPKGIKVDKLVRAEDGSLHKEDSYAERVFPEMRFNKKVLLDTLTPAKELSISALWKRLPKTKEIENEKQAEITTTFFHKIAIPWLCFLAVLAPAPFCVRYGRTHPVFLIYSLSLFALVGCYLLFNAALILGSRQVFPPSLVISFPFFIVFGITLGNFIKTK